MLWISDTLLVNGPSLVSTVVALIPDGVSVVGVGSTMDIKASDADISKVLLRSVEPSYLLDRLSLEWSHDSSIVIVEPPGSSGLNGHNNLSVSLSSDGSGSPVEDKPLLVVTWVHVSNSESVLSSTNVFFPE